MNLETISEMLKRVQHIKPLRFYVFHSRQIVVCIRGKEVLGQFPISYLDVLKRAEKDMAGPTPTLAWSPVLNVTAATVGDFVGLTPEADGNTLFVWAVREAEYQNQTLAKIDAESESVTV